MTEVIDINKSKINRPKDEIIFNNYHCVEIRPIKALPIYQFKLYPHLSLNGAYVLIKDNSEILKHIKSGEEVDMAYYPKKAHAPVEHFKTQILDITKKEQGPIKGHFQVGLSIVD